MSARSYNCQRDSVGKRTLLQLYRACYGHIGDSAAVRVTCR